jgi:hypothetical protein
VTLVVNPRGERGEDSEGDPVDERAAGSDDAIEAILDAPVGATQAMAVEGRRDG